MVTTTIPWSDGSGDNIYLTYSSASGDQTVTVSSDANTGSARTQSITFSATGAESVVLTVNQAAGTPTYTVVDYIQTDGTAYIDTGIESTSPKSCELKVLVPSVTNCAFLGKGQINTSSQNTGMFVPLAVYNSAAIFGYRFRYSSGAPSVSDSITNQTPFIARTRLKAGTQWIGVKQEGDTSWTSLSKTQGNAPISPANIYLFRTNYSTSWQCPSGSRVYYCKIYSDYDLTTLVFDGVPCYYNGEYGLWDNVTNSFFGSANSGTFSGPQV